MNVTEVIKKYENTIPVPVFEIITELGLGPTFQKLEDTVSGWIELKEDGSYHIVINESHSPTRKRFTAAHELGHYIYHRDLLGKGTGDTKAYRAENTPLPNQSIRPRHERQANTFAANLLMSSTAIDRLRSEGINDVEEMAYRLSVSEEAMKIRVGER